MTAAEIARGIVEVARQHLDFRAHWDVLAAFEWPVPSRTASKPATQRSSVLLPQPDGPRRQPISPGANAKERSCSTGVLP